MSSMPCDRKRLAETVRKTCLEAAVDAYEDARMRGLCPEGAWESAVGAIEDLDVADVIQEVDEAESADKAD